jgi:hypothetical protein
LTNTIREKSDGEDLWIASADAAGTKTEDINKVAEAIAIVTTFFL